MKSCFVFCFCFVFQILIFSQDIQIKEYYRTRDPALSLSLNLFELQNSYRVKKINWKKYESSKECKDPFDRSLMLRKKGYRIIKNRNNFVFISSLETESGNKRMYLNWSQYLVFDSDSFKVYKFDNYYYGYKVLNYGFIDFEYHCLEDECDIILNALKNMTLTTR